MKTIYTAANIGAVMALMENAEKTKREAERKAQGLDECPVHPDTDWRRCGCDYLGLRAEALWEGADSEDDESDDCDEESEDWS